MYTLANDRRPRLMLIYKQHRPEPPPTSNVSIIFIISHALAAFVISGLVPYSRSLIRAYKNDRGTSTGHHHLRLKQTSKKNPNQNKLRVYHFYFPLLPNPADVLTLLSPKPPKKSWPSFLSKVNY